jgi:teichuronic acid biosynthesis glycosyltransferase TuaC
MLVEEYSSAAATALWRRGFWVSLLVAVLALASLAPHLFASTELVRMRNALLLGDQHNVNFDWTPTNTPSDFLLERGPVDPFFADVAARLQLSALPGDWERAVAISHHLLASSGKHNGGAIKSDLRGTYHRIVKDGDGYCGDFVDIFMAIAIASGMPVRAWAFSFDGFGGHGHIWPEIWNRQLQRWQMVGVFNNHYFYETPGVPLSALEFRHALLGNSKQLRLAKLDPSVGSGWSIEAKAWDYYRRGLPQWYMWWGANLFTYDQALLVRAFAHGGRALEQLGAVIQGVHPKIRILEEPGNLQSREQLQQLRIDLFVAGFFGGCAALAALVCSLAILRLRRQDAKVAFARYTSVVAAATASDPQIIVLTNLFPHSGTSGAGPFIRERMFRVAKTLPLAVVVPVPWFPLQGLLRRFRPHFRPPAPRFEMMQGVPIFIPRFFSVPGVLRCMDGFSMAVSCWSLIRRLKQAHPQTIIDSHFAFPAGYAGVLLGKWLRLPASITMRGTEVSLAADPCRRARMTTALTRASCVIAVSDSLRQHAGVLGVDASRVKVIGNGVDVALFYPQDQDDARARYQIPRGVPVLVSVGGLVERKGFHRVIALLPKLLEKHPGLRYLVVGGASPEGDMVEKLRQQVADLKLDDVVQFLGALPPAEVRWPLSAANIFVLATSNEGWANVFLEAMACGLPVVTTNVGGNAEVVCRPELGTVVEFGNEQRLLDALDDALSRDWGRNTIIEYARCNTWDNRIAVLLDEFRVVAARHFCPAGAAGRSGNDYG